MSDPTPTDDRTDSDRISTVLQPDGGARPAAESECYDSEDGFHTCPDCGGECEYQSPEVVVCLACATEFSHFYDHDGTNNLFRAPDMEHVCAVYDPADDRRDDETVMTDGGSPETLQRLQRAKEVLLDGG